MKVVYDLATFELSDLPQFSREQETSDASFRWPNSETLSQLGKLSSLPRLTEIRTRGTADSGLSSIQLVFRVDEEDKLIESPVIDAQNPLAGPINACQVRADSRISAVEARTGTSWLCKLELKYEDGQSGAITEDFSCAGLSQTHSSIVPSDKQIMGVYGRMRTPSQTIGQTNYRICALGFILIDTSKAQNKQDTK